MNKILGIIGKRASGKDVLCSYLADKYKIPTIRLSTVLANIAFEKGWITKEELKD